jgi:hypothetical protein
VGDTSGRYVDMILTPALRLLGERIAINVVVPVLEKYRLPPVPALGHVMRKAGNHHAGKARHLGKLPQRKEKGIGIMSTHLQREPSAVIDDQSLVRHTLTLRGRPQPGACGGTDENR